MPTLIAVQASVSLTEPFTSGGNADEEERSVKRAGHSRVDFVKAAVRGILNHFGSSLKLDSVALIAYASSYEVLVPFTRDISAIEAGLAKITWKEGNNLEAVLHGAYMLMKQVDNMNASSCRAVFITDGHLGPISHALRRQLITDGGEDRCKLREPSSMKSEIIGQLSMMGLHGRTHSASSPRAQDFPLAFPFPFELHFITLCEGNDRSCLVGRAVIDKILDWNLKSGSRFSVQPSSGFQGMRAAVEKLCSGAIPIYKADLRCGTLSERVTLFPMPDKEMSRNLAIIGFLNLTDIGSPALSNRFVMYPLPPEKDAVLRTKGRKSAKKIRLSLDDALDDDIDDAKTPSLCVLLHAALRVANVTAIVRFDSYKFGMLFPSPTDARRRKLLLSVFLAGPKPVKEFGGPKDSPMSPDARDAGELQEDGGSLMDIDDDDDEDDAILEDDDETCDLLLPSSNVKTRPSYAANAGYHVWTDDVSLESDLMKIIRTARKLPEKTSVFFRELNRIRKNALGYGFDSLLSGLVMALEREAASHHSDAAVQLNHAAMCLREDPYAIVAPLPVKSGIR
ncbi:unnamed protein product [Notodromas monacha]|uniref:Integrator complex subunit 14 n=1 Tax=Notodromas monacha TaxID=399045 RepID=A0A7R9GB21_9CRUS|nr:unnamed protein product [Notodromas monacha]CAG0916065.1 unnamed protein product [Notodromas monacha]